MTHDTATPGSMVIKYSPAGVGTVFATWPGFVGLRNMCTDKANNLYVADSYDGRVYKVDPGGAMSIYAGIGFPYGYYGDGGLATSAALYDVSGVAIDTAGNLYISNYSEQHIRKVNPAGIISTYAGTGYGFSGDGGPATAATFSRIWGLAVDRQGNLYINDINNYRIRKVDKSTGNINTIAGTGSPLYNGDGILATMANMGPMNVFVDGSDNIFISDTINHLIRKIPHAPLNTITGHDSVCVGSSITLADTAFAGSGVWSSSSPAVGSVSATGIVAGLSNGTTTISYTFSNSCGTSVATKVVTVDVFPSVSPISGPSAICNSSSIIFSDAVAGGVWHSSVSTVVAIGSSSGLATGMTAGTTVISYSISNSCGTALTTNVLTVNVAYADGNIISTIAGTGVPGSSGDGSAATLAEIDSVIGIAVDTSGNIYLADYGNNSIRKINTSGVITTLHSGIIGLAGIATDTLGNVFYSEQSTGNVVKIAPSGTTSTVVSTSNPSALYADNAGNLFIAEQSEYDIFIRYASGSLGFYAGTFGVSGFGGDGGPATSANFNTITSIARDTSI